jgi:hypothetical protein
MRDTRATSNQPRSVTGPQAILNDDPLEFDSGL